MGNQSDRTYSGTVGPYKKSGQGTASSVKSKKKYYYQCAGCGLFLSKDNKQKNLKCPNCRTNMYLKIEGNELLDL